MNSYFVTREECPVCLSTEFREIYRNPFNEPPIKEYLERFYSVQGAIEFERLESAVYRLVECLACRLVFQREIPGDELMEILYERWIDPVVALRQYKDRADLTAYARRAEEVMQAIAHFKVNPSSLSFLDFGMGWGTWAAMANAFGCSSYGVELSPTRTVHARADGVTPLGREDLDRCRFDFVNADSVFEHIPKPLETLVCLRRALKPGGIIHICVPTANDVERRLRVLDWSAPKDSRDSLNPVAPLEHINCFRRETLVRMAARAGMREINVPINPRFRLAGRLATLRGVAKNTVLSALPGLRRDNIFLAGIPE